MSDEIIYKYCKAFFNDCITITLKNVSKEESWRVRKGSNGDGNAWRNVQKEHVVVKGR